MADQDVSTLSQGDVVVIMSKKGTDRQLRDRYIDTPTLLIYGSNMDNRYRIMQRRM